MKKLFRMIGEKMWEWETVLKTPIEGTKFLGFEGVPPIALASAVAVIFLGVMSFSFPIIVAAIVAIFISVVLIKLVIKLIRNTIFKIRATKREKESGEIKTIYISK